MYAFVYMYMCIYRYIHIYMYINIHMKTILRICHASGAALGGGAPPPGPQPRLPRRQVFLSSLLSLLVLEGPCAFS